MDVLRVYLACVAQEFDVSGPGGNFQCGNLAALCGGDRQRRSRLGWRSLVERPHDVAVGTRLVDHDRDTGRLWRAADWRTGLAPALRSSRCQPFEHLVEPFDLPLLVADAAAQYEVCTNVLVTHVAWIVLRRIGEVEVELSLVRIAVSADVSDDGVPVPKPV